MKLHYQTMSMKISDGVLSGLHKHTLCGLDHVSYGRDDKNLYTVKIPESVTCENCKRIAKRIAGKNRV